MVPELTYNETKYLSALKSICHIFEELKGKALDKQRSILNQNWEELTLITNSQSDLMDHLERNEKILSSLSTIERGRMPVQIDEIRKSLKDQMEIYRQIEKDNMKMLNDTLFVARQKVEKLFRRKERPTYSKNMKRESTLISGHYPVFLDRSV